MSNSRFPISRRTMLQGAGVSVALPWLEAMQPARAAEPQSEDHPTRMAVLFMPNGVHPAHWTPSGTGREFELSQTLEPLQELREELLILTNLWNQGSVKGDGHYVKTSGFLTCTTINKTVGVDLNCNGVSMDQVAAAHLRKTTPLASLELGTEPVRAGVDTTVGYTKVYGAHIAWRGPTSPLAKEIDPRLVFERMFRAAEGGGVEEARRDGPLVDFVLEDARRLRQRLGTADRQRIDEYLHSVHTLEQRLNRVSSTEGRNWLPKAALDPKAKPAGIPAHHAEHVRLMLDMLVLAFQTDTTRVCTFMFGNSVSNANFAFLDGVSGPHHPISHHQGNIDKLREYQLINRWHVAQYAYLLKRLGEIWEADRTLLDNSMVMFGSGLRDGNSHDPHNLPILLAGRGGGRLATGQHLTFGHDTPLANLYLSMLHVLGVEDRRFADSTGELPGLLS